MAYIGQGIKNGTFSVLDTSGNTYNGSNTTFNLGTQVGSPAQLLVSHDGVIQKPVTDYTIATGGTQITFTTAPASGASIFITEISGAVGAPMNRDINGDELILDADGDTSITADTDDQIDIRIGGTDALRFTGTALTGNAVATIGALGTASTLAGIPFYRDANDSIYTHDVSGTQSTAEANTAFGVGSLDAVTSGDANTSIGNGALSGNTTGSNNIAIGKAAINAADAETHNLAIGLNALSGSVNGGEYNIAIGNYTLDALTSGDNNTAVGYNAGTAVTTGSKNTMVGQMSGYDVADGAQNTLVGVEAGANVSSGNENTLVGERCGDVITTGSSNQMLGTNIDADAADGTNQITIGHNFVGPGDNYFAFGKASNIVSNLFTSNANWSRSSDRRKKRNIKDQKLGLDFINDLRTVTFQWKSSNEFPKEWREYSEENNMDMDVIMHGFIAQEVKEAMDKHGEKDFGGWSENKDGMQNTSREMFVIPLIKAVQELSEEVKELKAKLEDK